MCDLHQYVTQTSKPTGGKNCPMTNSTPVKLYVNSESPNLAGCHTQRLSNDGLQATSCRLTNCDSQRKKSEAISEMKTPVERHSVFPVQVGGAARQSLKQAVSKSGGIYREIREVTHKL